ncbi:MAG TPA: c-type cytochrome [Gallionella sp.]|nr:c-type cytochrome [Gallionella sp.]
MTEVMKFGIRTLLVVLVTAGAAQAAEGDPKAGKEKSAMCQGCHGEEGISAAPNFPNLAGQFQKYIERQIHDFQDGKRSDPMMSGMAASITEMQDLKDIAAYFSGRKRMKGTPGGNKALAEKGKVLFYEGNADTGVYACSNCHGENGYGKDAQNNVFPVISGQTKDYIVKQLNDFRSGDRHNDPAGMMGSVAKKMTPAEIDAVAEFVAGM